MMTCFLHKSRPYASFPHAIIIHSQVVVGLFKIILTRNAVQNASVIIGPWSRALVSLSFADLQKI